MKKSEFETVLKTNEQLSDLEIQVRYRILLKSIQALQTQHVNRDVSNDISYHYIPFPPLAFLNIAIEAFFLLGAKQERTFLDVGCGTGSTVLLANQLFDAYGLDYDQELVNVAQSLVGNRVFLEDAFEFDRYNEFDFIYYYRPFKDEDLHLAFEEKIFDHMKTGALVCPIWETFDWPNYTKQVGRFVYQKQ